MPLGDDLDDGLDYQVDSSEGENFGDVVEEQPNHSASDSENAKRPHSAGEEDETAKQPQSKRQKKLAKSKVHQKKLEKLEADREQKKQLPRSSSERIAEHLGTLIREKNPDLSALELEELYFKKTDFISTERYDKERSLHNILDFVNNFSKSPRAIVLSTSNLRVADVFRGLGGSKNAVKLFSKNKLKEDLARVDQLLKAPSSKDRQAKNKGKKKGDAMVKFFTATPGRMLKIVQETDAFFLGKDKLDIFVDASYLDPKMNTIFTSDDCTALLKVLKEFLGKKSSVKILLF
ncbi:Cms1p [Lachancea thermotolerans CBS 6340]|uniref:KLTH0B02728p n=1 Tax=Lachancea thermotolerans (strain ATCC 56472 / CBS 6340 / NRRL Y-8284) TaxID=559295 RepID=C5DCF9_LACTC|nr:KLTH0B02728p [Lachancea thermotolerans CBS 6340]CAR21470.1 KLTH0B02728p [Lachancea thermotolerans CBS 6340]